MSRGVYTPYPNAQLAQYFTPRDVAHALWRLLAKRQRGKQGDRLRVIDLSAGSGVWLEAALVTGRVDPADIYSIEIDAQWKDRPGIAHVGDALLGTFAGVNDGGFDLVVGNPPFGKLSAFNKAMNSPTREDFAQRFPMWVALGENEQSYPIEWLFMERALQMLRPGGWGVHILPEGFFTNARLQTARDYLLKELVLTDVIQLPSAVFRGNGLNARTAAVVFQKRRPRGRIEVRLVAPTELVTSPADYLEQVRLETGSDLVEERIPLAQLAGKRWDPGYWKGLSQVRSLGRRFATEPLGDFIEHLTYGPIVTGRKPDPVKGGTPIIRQGDIAETGLDENALLRVECCGDFDPERSRVRPGDLLFPRSGAGALGRNRLAVYTGSDRANVGCFVDLVRLRGINPYFTWLFFKTQGGWGQIAALINGVGTPNINFGEIRSLRIVRPTQEVQATIEHRYLRDVLPWHQRRLESSEARALGETAFRSIVRDLQGFLVGEISEQILVDRG